MNVNHSIENRNNENRSIAVNLDFQDALRVFADAQTVVSVMERSDPGYAKSERNADEAAWHLAETIDRIIERRMTLAGMIQDSA